MKAPFPWFGGKSRAAPMIWQALGNVPNYVEPFAGSLAALLLRPHPPGIETVNDADGLISNFWRALAADPDELTRWADWPVNEADLHARHAWLVGQRDELTARLQGDPDYYDAKVAGWWVWGICSWIGSGWCSGNGPWHSIDGRLVKAGNAGRGINRKRPHLGNAGRGINRKRPHLGNAGRGIRTYLGELSERLRGVRVCCGDWTRVLGDSPTVKNGLTGILLDPPYAHSDRDNDLYRIETDCAGEVREWAIEHGDNPRLRVVLCGYEGQAMPAGWTVIRWKEKGGYGSQGQGRGRANTSRETLWCSPHCLQYGLGLFADSVSDRGAT